MEVILRFSELPQSAIDDAGSVIPTLGDDLVHPYKPDSKLWMAHCHNGGCGEYLDDSESVPPADLLCDRCEEHAEE
jgi:hypothetical protein